MIQIFEFHQYRFDDYTLMSFLRQLDNRTVFKKYTNISIAFVTEGYRLANSY